MLIVLIAAPLAILLIGPIGIWIGSAISALVYPFMVIWAGFQSPLWALAYLLVMTGMHRVFTPTIIQTIAKPAKKGWSCRQRSALTCRWAVHHWQWRGKRKPGTASDGAGCGGINHYGGDFRTGVIWRGDPPETSAYRQSYQRFLFAARLPVWRGLASHSMAAPGLFTSVQFFDPANPMSIVWVFAVMALAVVLSFILTLLLGFEDIPVEEAAAQARKYQSVQPTVAKEEVLIEDENVGISRKFFMGRRACRQPV